MKGGMAEPRSAATGTVDVNRRLELFDAATVRQDARQAGPDPAPAPKNRGWSREELYEEAANS